ncbi:MAG: hypothetical protein ABI321_16545 [Polyangia bacterium]
MRKIILALTLAVLSITGAAQAAPHYLVAPSTRALKSFIKNAKVTPIKPSQAHNSQAYHFTQALLAKPSVFRALKIGKQGPDFGTTAYIPKVQIKGLASNTAYLSSQSIVGPRLQGKVKLPLF